MNAGSIALMYLLTKTDIAIVLIEAMRLDINFSFFLPGSAVDKILGPLLLNCFQFSQKNREQPSISGTPVVYTLQFWPKITRNCTNLSRELS